MMVNLAQVKKSRRKDMKRNASRPKEGDVKQRVSAVALAPSYASKEDLSFQVERSESNKKSLITEARSSPQSARQAKKKAKEDEGGQYSSDESSEYDEENQPDPYGIAGPQVENHHRIEEDQPTVDGSKFVDVSSGTMLVYADLAPELTSAEAVNIQEEEEIIVKKKEYMLVLRNAMVLYGCAIICNITSFAFLFVNPPLAFGGLDNILWSYGAATYCALIATIVILIPTKRCCRSSISLEEYAPADMQQFRNAQIVSVASCLLALIAIPIFICLPDLIWFGCACMTWSFAGTVFTFSRVLLLRRSQETRKKKPRLLWVLFVLFFIGLTSISIWLCLNPLYPDCHVPDASFIGDGFCDGEPYASAVCGYDGGDCVKFLQDYPGCIVRDPFQIADGHCDGGTYNTVECGHDGGDCAHENENEDYPDCIVPNPSWIGNGNCDGRVYGTVECGFDGGDCLGPGETCRRNRDCASEVCNSVTKVCDSVFVSELYPNCMVDMPEWLGDGECDGGYYASEACGFDGGDCLELGKPCLQNEECASGFCSEDTKVCYLGILENYPDCLVDFPQRIGDGKCDGGAYASEKCGYDGGDCLNPASQISSGSPTVFSSFHIAGVVVLHCFQSFFNVH